MFKIAIGWTQKICQKWQFWKKWNCETLLGVYHNFGLNQKKVVEWENRLIPWIIKESANSLKNPKHINKISNMISWNMAFQFTVISMHKKWSSLLSISSVNVTKSEVSCGFGHIYCRNP